MQLFGFYASGAMTIMMFIALASVAGLVVPLVALFRSRPVRASWSPPAGESRAVTILRERFARGDISEDEYRRRLDVLAKGRRSDPKGRDSSTGPVRRESADVGSFTDRSREETGRPVLALGRREGVGREEGLVLFDGPANTLTHEFGGESDAEVRG